jgi:hypothetical protein
MAIFRRHECSTRAPSRAAAAWPRRKSARHMTQRISLVGMRPDPATAASWYRRAIALGDAETETVSLLQRVDEIAPR